MPERPQVPAWWRWSAVWRRNVLVWRRLAVASVLGNFGEPLLYLLALGFGLGALVGEVEGMPYIAFLASGIVCSSAMTTAAFEATYSAYTRMEPQRTWDALLTTPLTVRDVVLGEVAWAASKSLFSSVAILVVAVALGVAGGWSLLLVPPVALLTGFCFAGIAMVVTACARSYEFFMYFQTLLLTPMLLLSGVFFPLSRMPEAVQAGAQALPLVPSVALVRPAMTGGESDAVVLHLLVLAGWGLAGLLVATLLCRRRFAR